MQPSPGLWLAAFFLWFLPLLSLRHEMQFLASTPGLPWTQRACSLLVFACFLGLDATLAFHHLFPDIATFTLVLLTFLLAMLILSFVLLRGRVALFRELSRTRNAERREMLEEVRILIDEKKRAKIRAKYGE
ncbi:MAG: hypothetical protein ABI743_04670 [bacterium]